MSRYLLDTNIFIYHFKHEPKIKNFIMDAIKKNDTISFSFITRLELLAIPKINEEVKSKIDGLLNELNRINYNERIEEIVLKITDAKRIKIPDAIIAASAIFTDSIFVTNNIKDFPVSNELKLLNPFE